MPQAYAQNEAVEPLPAVADRISRRGGGIFLTAVLADLA
jgi:hypothetical protein